MYSATEIKIFKKKTEDLLQKDVQEVKLEEASNLVNDLHDVISFHDHLYYIKSAPVITDFEYDRLFKMLKDLEYRFPQLIDPDSPTQRVALGLNKEFPVVNHLVPMLSLDNSYNEADLKDFDRKVREQQKTGTILYSLEPKFDGTGISLVYENDRLLRGVTRGDGIMGEDVTPNIKVLRSIPIKAAFSKYGIHTIEIRGEGIIRKKAFETYNKQREEAGLEKLANPRNAASGSLRMLDSTEVAKRNLDAFLYQVSYAVDAEGNDLLGSKLNSHTQIIRILQDLGFKVPPDNDQAIEGIEKVMQEVSKWEEKRDSYEYEIDGLVIKVDDLHLQDKLGSTSHHPRWSMAYKFKARQARTLLENVEFQVGRIGTITPVAKLKPVHIGGVTVTSASMFNEDFIKEKDIRIGDEVLVERAGDVIPYIASVIKEARTGDEKEISFPENCPVCDSKLHKEGEEAAWKCINPICPAQMYWKLVHFVSKDAMDITGLGKANIEKFMEHGWLKTIEDIYTLPFDEIQKLEGFGKRSVDKLKESVEKSKSNAPYRLLFGLGIRYIGEATAKSLATEVKCLEDFKDWSKEQFNAIHDIGEKMAGSIYDYFQEPKNITLLTHLKSLGVNTCAEERTIKSGSQPLEGLTFLFTGSLEHFSRTEAKEKVEEAGGKVASALSSKVDYLVVGLEPGSKVEKAKKLDRVKIISEKDLLSMLSHDQ